MLKNYWIVAIGKKVASTRGVGGTGHFLPATFLPKWPVPPPHPPTAGKITPMFYMTDEDDCRNSRLCHIARYIADSIQPNSNERILANAKLI